MSQKPTFQYLYLEQWSIFDQLKLEEALLRADTRNWCIFNMGSAPAIVLGISGKTEQLVDNVHHNANPVPLIRRFSGGGTVFVDKNTLFITYICNSQEFSVPCFPKDIMKWTEGIYDPVFEGLEFRVRENDYVIGDKKFGGNAQYLQKNRWLHHSTLLWDYDHNNMQSLKIPPKMPDYRKERAHSDFLCTLKEHFTNPHEIVLEVVRSLSRKYDIESTPLHDFLPVMEKPHRKATVII